MRKLLRWLGIGLGGLVALAIVAAIAVFALSEIVLRKEHRAFAEALAVPSAVQLADAERQARILGCLSCHGEGLKGKLMFDAPPVARVYAPNLTRIAAGASDQQLAAAIRQGIGHDGRSLFIMPSATYSRLSDGEVAALIAWIRKLPFAEGGLDRIKFGPIGRFALATGKFRAVPDVVAEYRTKAPLDAGPGHASGRTLASRACSGCHGPALFGQTMDEGSVAPDLNLAAGYDLAQFTRLLRTGETPSAKPLGLMKEVALNDFRHLTDGEIAALHAYLEARAKKLGS